MTRTIYIIFPESESSYSTTKRYAFLCNYDCVRKCDKIRDPRYTSPMLVVDITPCTDRVQNGITLKDIYITHINDRLLIQPSGLVNGTIIGSDYDVDLIHSKVRKYLGENDRIYCSTPEEARKVVDIYYTLGYIWFSSDKTDTNYFIYKDKSVYSIKKNHYIAVGNIEVAKYCNRNIIPAKEFIDYYTTNDMEKRNIKVTLEQATEWYNSGNETLRTLALTVFTEEELTLNMKYIHKAVNYDTVWIDTPLEEVNKHKALSDLAMIAKYFNGSWKKTPNNTGYSLAQFNTESLNDIIKGVRIVAHNTVMYPGIVYFKEKEGLIKAVKIMGDKIKDLF